jgi:hypothetical protein
VSIASERLLGRHAGGSGAGQEVTVGNGIEFQGSGIRRSALTGDVTAPAGSNSTVIANDSVTNAKLANVPTATIKGRATAGTGDLEDLTPSQAIEVIGAETPAGADAKIAAAAGLPKFLAENAFPETEYASSYPFGISHMPVNWGAQGGPWWDSLLSFGQQLGVVVTERFYDIEDGFIGSQSVYLLGTPDPVDPLLGQRRGGEDYWTDWELPVTPERPATLANKRITARVTSIASSATPAINTDNCDMVSITALATDITSMTTNLTGTPSNGDMLLFRIKDDGTARAITWGASFVPAGAALPTTTVLSKVLHALFIWDSVAAEWYCLSTAQEE